LSIIYLLVEYRANYLTNYLYFILEVSEQEIITENPDIWVKNALKKSGCNLNLKIIRPLSPEYEIF